MKKIVILCLLFANAHAQRPCSSSAYRQFDFWLGEWVAYSVNGQKAGDSKISLILDSCIILEEWTSASVTSGLRYAGKSFNTWNAEDGQWQQTWVDNTGTTTFFSKGKFEGDKIIFNTLPFRLSPDTLAVRRLTFYNISHDKVRQLGEISRDDGSHWQTEYDLEYRRKK